MRLARFARVRLLRHSLPISLPILRNKTIVLQSSFERYLLQDEDQLILLTFYNRFWFGLVVSGLVDCFLFGLVSVRSTVEAASSNASSPSKTLESFAFNAIFVLITAMFELQRC